MKKLKKKKLRKVTSPKESNTFTLKGINISINKRLGYTSKEWKVLQRYCETRDGGKHCVNHNKDCFGAMQLHHRKPLSKGGTNRPTNLEWICHLHHCIEHPFMIQTLLKKYYS